MSKTISFAYRNINRQLEQLYAERPDFIQPETRP